MDDALTFGSRDHNLARHEYQEGHLGVFHPVDQPGEHFWLVLHFVLLQDGHGFVAVWDLVVGQLQLVQVDGELHIRGSHYILYFNSPARVGGIILDNLINDLGILAPSKGAIVLGLSPSDDHFARLENKCRGLRLLQSHNHGRKPIRIVLSILGFKINLFQFQSAVQVHCAHHVLDLRLGVLGQQWRNSLFALFFVGLSHYLYIIGMGWGDESEIFGSQFYFQLLQLKQQQRVSQQLMNFNHLANAIVPQATSAFSIPVKICDGLFMADHFIAQDSEFFETNLITHVINCAGQEVQNSHKVSGVAFLTFDWSERVTQNITEQKVVSVTVNFIEECRKEAGCLLINYFNSESRPFCLLACYFMVRFKWSLFKTLEFLNSRKEDVELEPEFFNQLTNFAQKLQDKGLIRSKTWALSQGMSDQQIIITNTYLNSKNKFPPAPPSNNAGKNRNKNSVTWKKDLVQEHTYCPNSAICQRNEKLEKEKQVTEKQERQQQRKSLIEPSRNSQKTPVNISRQKREQSLKKPQKQSVHPQSQPQLQPQRANIIQQQKQKPVMSTSMTEMNVTRKWAQLREMWLREKENHNSGQGNKGNYVSQKQQTPIIVKKDGQRINDRLQEKLNLLKKHEQKMQLETSTRPPSKKQHSDIIDRNTNANTIEAQKNEEKAPYPNQESNSRIVHNNWIIDNQVVGDGSGHRNSKNKLHANAVSNKSVIIVKPNHGSASLDNKNQDKLRDSSMFNSNANTNTNANTGMGGQSGSNHASRSSLRKVAGSERKEQNNSSLNKQNATTATTKFFRNEATDIITTKGRCSSAKPQRKENINPVALGLGLTKNGSLKGKGKWKF